MPKVYIDKENFDLMYPTFKGKRLEDVAKEVGSTVGSLRARLSRGHYGAEIREGVIVTIDLSSIEESIPEKIIRRKNKDLPYKEPTKIVLPSDEYFEMIAAFRRKNHRRCRS